MKNMIHISIDGREANVKNRVGSNVYAFEIIVALEKLLSGNKYNSLKNNNFTKNTPNIKITVLLATDKISDLPKERENWTYKVFGPKKFWTQWALPIHIFQHQKDYDIFFTPGHYAPRICAIPYISSVMDTAYIDYPEQFKKSDTLKLTKWTEYSVKKASRVIAISKYTKSEIIKNYQKASKDIVIAYPAVKIKKLRFEAKQVNNFFRKHKITEPYILFVGTLQPRKNIIKLIEAFEVFDRMNAGRGLKKKTKKSLYKNQKKVKLVLAGKIGWLSDDILEKINSSPLSKRIITTGFVSEAEKQILYKYAFASCLVGIHEGFGIPPLESIYFNTPPIVSNTTSLPEVIGKAGFLANPDNSQDIANKIWQAFSLTTREKGLFRKEARKQVKKFDWGESAEIILESLLKVVSKENGEDN